MQIQSWQILRKALVEKLYMLTEWSYLLLCIAPQMMLLWMDTFVL